jgi:hypothetical protein
MHFVIYGLAFFFAITWTGALIMIPSNRLICSVVGVFYWWVAIIGSFILDFNYFHLLWLMPLSLFTSGIIMYIQMRWFRPKFWSNLILTGVITISAILLITH